MKAHKVNLNQKNSIKGKADRDEKKERKANNRFIDGEKAEEYADYYEQYKDFN